jgi:hypothetical protein
MQVDDLSFDHGLNCTDKYCINTANLDTSKTAGLYSPTGAHGLGNSPHLLHARVMQL